MARTKRPDCYEQLCGLAELCRAALDAAGHRDAAACGRALRELRLARGRYRDRLAREFIPPVGAGELMELAQALELIAWQTGRCAQSAPASSPDPGVCAAALGELFASLGSFHKSPAPLLACDRLRALAAPADSAASPRGPYAAAEGLCAALWRLADAAERLILQNL